MELNEAKQIIRSLEGKSFLEAIKVDNVGEAIRMVCEVAHSDSEASYLQSFIPSEMHFMGLYPHVQRPFDTMPKIAAVEEMRKQDKMRRDEQEVSAVEPKFKVGDKVYKPNGYKFFATIVSVFKTVSGDTRVVAENEDGLLHIFNESNLELQGH